MHSILRFEFGDLNLREKLVNGLPGVVEGGCPHDDPNRAKETGDREQPKEQPVQHHSDEFPILNDLKNAAEVVLGISPDSRNS